MYFIISQIGEEFQPLSVSTIPYWRQHQVRTICSTEWATMVGLLLFTAQYFNTNPPGSHWNAKLDDELQAYIPSSNTEVEQTAWTSMASIICQSFEWVHLQWKFIPDKGEFMWDLSFWTLCVYLIGKTNMTDTLNSQIMLIFKYLNSQIMLMSQKR